MGYRPAGRRSIGPAVRVTQEVRMPVETPVQGTGLTRSLCLVVFIVMAVAVVYAGWIGVINYSRIHV